MGPAIEGPSPPRITPTIIAFGEGMDDAVNNNIKRRMDEQFMDQSACNNTTTTTHYNQILKLKCLFIKYK